jgi:hypothetical protein
MYMGNASGSADRDGATVVGRMEETNRRRVQRAYNRRCVGSKLATGMVVSGTD